MTIYKTPEDDHRDGNCGVTAIALLSGQPFETVFAHLGKNKRANWKGCLSGPEIFNGLKHFGLNPVKETELTAEYFKRSVGKVANNLRRDRRPYIMFTRSHAFSLIDGRLFDQNTESNGAAPAEYWAKNKKVQMIISVDRLPETKVEEPTPMTDLPKTVEITIPETSLFGLAAAFVAEHEAAFQATNGEAKDLRGTANVSKIAAYGQLIHALIVNNIKKGSKRAGAFRAALEEAGVSKACAKRYMEIGQAATKLPIMKDAKDIIDRGDQTTSGTTLFGAVLEDNDIKTEAALKNVCFPIVEKSLVEKLVEAAKAGTDTDDEALQALLDAAAAINPAAQDVANTLVAAINRKVAA